MRCCVLTTALVGLLIGVPGRSMGSMNMEGRRIQLRVMTISVPVRAGPGGSYRQIGRVGQGQVYEAIDRSHDGAWYRIRLARGLSGWVLAELVWPFEIVDPSDADAASGWLASRVLGPSHLADAAVSLTLGAGALDADEYIALRIGYQPSRSYLIEAVIAQSAGRLGGLLVYGAELLIHIGPWRTVVPFAAAGVGAATTLPHRDAKLFGWRTRPVLTAGGGLLLALRGALSLRIDARQLMAYDPDESWSALSISAGLMLTF